jgi:hypothetical protein
VTLVLLGAPCIFLRSTHRTQTYFTFEDTLTQIGPGYPILRTSPSANPSGGSSSTGYIAGTAIPQDPKPGGSRQLFAQVR